MANEATTLAPVPENGVMRIDPDQEVTYASRCANALMGIIEKKKQKVVINGKTYLTFEDWQTVARFYNLTVGTEWTKVLTDPEDDKKIWGYEARAVVYNPDGKVISGAEAMCMRNENLKWGKAPVFQLRSMAQTRACAKALRSILAFVPVLAGYEATPAEEIEDDPPASHAGQVMKEAMGK